MASSVAQSAPVRDASGRSCGPRTSELSAGEGLYALHVTLWDLHAARAMASRLCAAGVDPSAVRVRGRRRADGLQEAEVRPRRVLTTRWKLNMVMAVAAAVVVGVPMGASLATLLLGEHPVVAAVGALVGGMALAAVGISAVWADHLQRRPGSRHATRVEGHLVVAGPSVVRAELLLHTTPDVMAVQRLPGTSDPLAWPA